MTAQTHPPLRIALSVTSAASLGAFEAGATAALVTAIQRLNTAARAAAAPRPVVLDTVGATSAGALVALLTTRSLLAGLDPVWVLHRAWVERASLARLMSRRDDAPLSLAAVRDDLGDLLDPRDRRGRPVHRVAADNRQAEPIKLSIALGNLQGLSYDLPEVGKDPSVAAMTHVDWADYLLTREDDAADYRAPAGRCVVDAVLASMSHPAAFPPRGLDRSPDRGTYEAQGVVNFPRSGHFWYCDGSALVTHPFARTLESARGADEEAALRQERRNRVHVLVHPHTAAPAGDDTWTDPSQPPSWPSTVSRLLAALTTQALYDGMREIERVNARVRWSAELGSLLAEHLDEESAGDLRDLLTRIRRERRELGDTAPDSAGGVPAATTSVADLASQVVAEVSGTGGRPEVRTEVISPLRLLSAAEATAHTAEREHEIGTLLAGEFLGRFGGFTQRALRQSDFALGWHSCRAWLPEALRRGGLSDDVVEEAVGAVDERQVDYGHRGPRGGATSRDLPLSARLRLATLVLRAARKGLRDTTRSSR